MSPVSAITQNRRNTLDLDKIRQATELLLEGLGINPLDPNFTETPGRVAKMYMELFGNGDMQPKWFPERAEQMVLVRHHTMWTMCPHHLLLVELDVSAAYLAGGQLLGLSKLPRLMQMANDQPRTQEDLTARIASSLMQGGAKGSACLIIGKHGCMASRGVKTTADAVTTALRGVFNPKAGAEHNPGAKQEFLDMVLNQR